MKIFLDSTNNTVDFVYESTSSDFNKELSQFQEAIKINDIRVGFELEFYLLGENASEEMDYLLKVGLASFAKKATFLPEGIEFNKKSDTWYIERDPTLDSTPFGFELVSPLLSLSEFQYYFNMATDLISYIGKTQDDCGVHVHVSSKNLEDVDLTKLILFMDDSNILGDWKHRSNYAKDIVEVFRNTKVDDFIKFSDEMSTFYSINNIAGNHLELRCFGGEGYEKKANRDKITEDFFSFLPVYKTACSQSTDYPAYQSLLLQKQERTTGQNPVTSDEIRALYGKIMEEYRCDSDVAIEIAMQLLEETRLVRRATLEEELSNEYFPSPK